MNDEEREMQAEKIKMARVFMLFFPDGLQGARYVQCVKSQSPGRHLAMEDGCTNVGVIGGRLTPADMATVRSQFDKADKFIGEGFQLADLHGKTL